MIVERPFVSRKEIIAAYRPGSADSESAFRTLRAHGHVSQGVTVPVRSAGGRLRGSLWLYSALNRDAARLARQGNRSEARAAARQAAMIEGGAASQTLVAAFAEVSTDRDDGPAGGFDQALQRIASRSDLRPALRDMFAATTAARDSLHGVGRGNRWRYGRVEQIDRDVALILDYNGQERIMIPLVDLEARGLGEVGDPVVVHWERWGSGQVMIDAERALDLSPTEETEQDEPGFLNSTLALSPSQQADLDELLAGRGTIAVPAATLVPNR